MDHTPLTVVIFGSTGDLYQKKLARALFDLHRGGFLGKDARIIGYGRKLLSLDEFKAYTKGLIVKDKKPADEKELDGFMKDVFYEKGSIENPEDYKILADAIDRYDSDRGAKSNRLFYLAVPPMLYGSMFKSLSTSGLARQKGNWARILVEKPFGNNLKEARALDVLLGKLFTEDQVFRIDHYLAKEGLQNLLTFRFSNSIFNPVWDRGAIEKVEIRFLEKHIVGDRGSFYDGIGALRDVGQNHMLQMLAFVAMEKPKTMDAESIRIERERVLKSTSIFKRKGAAHFERAQYEGYKDDKGVSTGSQTETYFKVTLGVNNKRWRGVPFYLESGKAFGESRVDIKIFFKDEGPKSQNILSFSLQPRECISVLFWSKKPGFDFELEPQELSFVQKSDELVRRIPDAYERVLFDCIQGDQTLFTSTKEVKYEWTVIMDLLSLIKKMPLRRYKKGKQPAEFIVS